MVSMYSNQVLRCQFAGHNANLGFDVGADAASAGRTLPILIFKYNIWPLSNSLLKP